MQLGPGLFSRKQLSTTLNELVPWFVENSKFVVSVSLVVKSTLSLVVTSTPGMIEVEGSNLTRTVLNSN